MGICGVCGNDSDLAFSIRTSAGRVYMFDSFECAIQMCAPRCAWCSCPVIGHGREADGVVYCSVRCLRSARVSVDMAAPETPETAGAGPGDAVVELAPQTVISATTA